MSDTKNFEVITAAAERLSVSPGRSYRTWSREEKDRIVGETFAPGANVSAIARCHGIDPSQLFAWRRKALASGMVAPLSGARDRSVKFARFETMAGEMVEIVIGDVVVRVGGDVEAGRLAAVIRAVRQA
ncbi:transposase [Bradyrhizobium genosp. P]|uniref:transposase n=1 Tax=Bradyrhizobium genosp. P TaxID=83641 RepID=UPI003CFB2987